MQSQIYWVLPIAIGYAKTKGIKEIILEKITKLILKIELKFLSLVKFIIYLRLSFGFFY